MNKIITLMMISVLVLTASCKWENSKHLEKTNMLTPITQEYFVGKQFVKPAIMGGRCLEFIDNEKVKFSIHDKRSFGYSGTYTLENKGEKQYIKITNIEKFGKIYDWQDALKGYDKDYVMVEIISPTKLKVIHSGTILQLDEQKQKH